MHLVAPLRAYPAIQGDQRRGEHAKVYPAVQHNGQCGAGRTLRVDALCGHECNAGPRKSRHRSRRLEQEWKRWIAATRYHDLREGPQMGRVSGADRGALCMRAMLGRIAQGRRETALLQLAL